MKPLLAALICTLCLALAGCTSGVWAGRSPETSPVTPYPTAGTPQPVAATPTPLAARVTPYPTPTAAPSPTQPEATPIFHYNATQQLGDQLAAGAPEIGLPPLTEQPQLTQIAQALCAGQMPDTANQDAMAWAEYYRLPYRRLVACPVVVQLQAGQLPQLAGMAWQAMHDQLGALAEDGEGLSHYGAAVGYWYQGYGQYRCCVAVVLMQA